jgi:hypothetical protein
MFISLCSRALLDTVENERVARMQSSFKIQSQAKAKEEIVWLTPRTVKSIQNPETNRLDLILRRKGYITISESSKNLGICLTTKTLLRYFYIQDDKCILSSCIHTWTSNYVYKQRLSINCRWWNGKWQFHLLCSNVSDSAQQVDCSSNIGNNRAGSLWPGYHNYRQHTMEAWFALTLCI